MSDFVNSSSMMQYVCQFNTNAGLFNTCIGQFYNELQNCLTVRK